MHTDTTAPAPKIADRARYQAELDALRIREKAHTHEGDAIAAAHRRLPMVEVDAAAKLIGANGPITLLEAFEGRRQLIAYFHMWHTGHPAAEQCEGCTFFNSQVRELSYLHARDVTYATFCQGTYEESVRYRDFMDWDVPWYSAAESIDVLMARRGPFMLACYLRRGERVFETYWTTGRGVEVMGPVCGLLDRTVPYTGGRRRGRTRRSAGRGSPATAGVRTDVPPPNGLAWGPDAATTSQLGIDGNRTGTPNRAEGPATVRWPALFASGPVAHLCVEGPHSRNEPVWTNSHAANRALTLP